MKIAKVVGNLISTIKDETFHGYKLMIVEYLNPDGTPDGKRQIAFDAAHAGIGDIVLVNIDGGAATMFTGDKELIADLTICGVLDSFTINGRQTVIEHGQFGLTKLKERP
ncbi:ethanolamine utilization protein EutN [Spirochaetia bacterium]|nr:ethanolamine utilization protein EutN [Spirochaetia bacterium]